MPASITLAQFAQFPPDLQKDMVAQGQVPADWGQSVGLAVAPQRSKPQVLDLVTGIAIALEAIYATGKPFSATSVINRMRAAAPSINIQGDITKDAVRLVLISDRQASRLDLPHQAFREEVLKAINTPDLAEALHNGQIVELPGTIQGLDAIFYAFVA